MNLEKNVDKNVLLRWWVDGFVSCERTSINFWNKKNNEKFQGISKITKDEIEQIKEGKEFDELCEDDWYYALLSFRLLFNPDNTGTYGCLETALRDLSGIGIAEFYSVGESKIKFTYSQSHAESNFKEIPDEYRDFIERISRVMVD